MRITIVRFKCFTQTVTYDFKSATLTLLDGPSGIGKSTIFEAINWCLFGNVQQIYPKSSASTAKSQTCVMIEFPEVGLVMRRTKPPELIEITYQGAHYSGSEAQARIEEVFGKKDFFNSSSYVKQKTLCPLITYSNADKTKLLHELTFGDQSFMETDNPELYINKIEDEIKQLKSVVIAETSKYNVLLQTYSQASKNGEELYLEWNNANTSIEAVNNQQSKFEEYIKEMEVLHSKQNHDLQILKTLNQSKSQLVERLVKPIEIDINLDEQIHTLEDQLRNVEQYEKIVKEKELLESQLFQYSEEELNMCQEENIEILTDKIGKITCERNKCQALNIKYDKNTIDNEILKLKYQLKTLKLQQEDLSRWNEEKLEATKLRDETYNSQLEEWEKQCFTLKLQYEDTLSSFNKMLLEWHTLKDQMIEAHRKEYSKELEIWNSECDILKLQHSQVEAQNQEVLKQWYQEKDQVLSLHQSQHQLQMKEWTETCSALRLKYEEVRKIKMDIESDKKVFEERQTNFLVLSSKIDTCKLNIEKSQAKVNITEKDLNEKITVLKGNFPNILATPQSLQSQIDACRILQQQLLCPHCSEAVTFQSGKLIKGITVDSQGVLSAISYIESTILTLNSYNDAIKELKFLEHELKTLGPLPPNPTPKSFPDDIVIEDLNLPPQPQFTSPIFNPQPVFENNILKLPSKPIESSIVLPPKPLLNEQNLILPSKPQCLSLNLRPQPIIEENIENLSNKVLKLQDIYIYDENLQDLIDQCDRLRSIKHLTPLFERLKTLKQFLTLNYDIKSDEIKIKIIELKELKSSYLQKLSTYESLLQQINNLEEQINLIQPSTENYKEKLDQCKSSLSILNRLKKAHEVHLGIKHQYDQVLIQKEVLLKYVEYEGNLNKLKLAVSELASSAMEETVEAINENTALILNDMFTKDDIQVILSTHKELKTKDTTKLQVNLKIKYKDQEFSSISELSGGEQDRVSLALTLAIAKVSGTSILLLDECIQSVDKLVQEECLDVIKKHFANKIVINICHDAVKGDHTETLSLE
jgi:DNA repair exonuclease SbcCD ATPase subunit